MIDEKFALALISVEKSHMKVNGKNNIVEYKKVDGDKIKTTKTLFKPFFSQPTWKEKRAIHKQLALGFFCKVKEENLTQNTYNIELYYFADPESTNAIQLLRLDKVADTF